jgi:chromosome segregation ATPase
MATAREKILGHVAPKTVFGEVVTGSGLAMLATAYVKAINTGAVPDIRKSWDYVVEETLRLAFEAATSSFKQGLGSYCKSVLADDAVLPDRDAYTAKVAEETATSNKVFIEKGGQMAKPQMPGPWIEKLVEERTALGERGLSTLHATSQQRCTALAQQVLEAQLRQPVSEGSFDDVQITVFEEAVRSALSKYENDAAGPAKAEVAVQVLTGKPLLDVFGTLQRRLQQQAEAKLAASESALRAEEEAKRGLEAVLESRNELVSQLEAAKAETEAELTRTRESLKNIETELGTTREELHAVQRAKDVLESELGESRRLHQEEVARGEAAKQEAETRLTEERQSAAERAASAKEAHEAVVKGRDEQISTLNSSIEREQALAQEASSRHDAQIASLQGEKEGLQARIESVEEARDADRKAATAAAEQAAEKAAELAALISEQKAQLEVAAAQKAAVESELANEKNSASAAAANAEATAADLRTRLEVSQATCGEMGEARTALEQQHAAVVRGLDDQIAEFNRQVEDAAREAERQAEMHQIALDNSKGQQALATQEAAEHAKEQEEKMAALMKSNEEAATEITALGKDVEARLQQLTEAQKEIQTLEAEVSRVEAELKTTLEKNVRQTSQQLVLPILF